MTQTAEIRRHPNGSLDIEHYARIGRALHGQAVRGAGRTSFGAPGRLLKRASALLGRLVAAITGRPRMTAAKIG